MGGLQQISGCADSKRFRGQFTIRIHREKDKLRPREKPFYFFACVEAIQKRHTYVYDHDVGLKFHGGLEQRATVADTAHDVVHRLKQPSKAFATYLVVICQQNLYSSHMFRQGGYRSTLPR